VERGDFTPIELNFSGNFPS